MKKVNLFAILSICLILTYDLFAQSQRLKGGLAIGGVNSHWEFPSSATSPDEDWTNAWGWHLAVPIEYSFNDHLALQGEITWSQKGTTLNMDWWEDDIFIMTKSKTLLNYVDLPLMLKVSTKPGKVQAFAYGGGYYGVALNAKMDINVTATWNGISESASESQDLDLEEIGASKRDAGWLLGGGLRFGQAYLEARYMHGVHDIDTNEGPEAVIYNRYTVFTLGFFY